MTQEDFVPKPRSGHSTVVHGNKMYIFGGILELTHELNDLIVFDFETRKFSLSGADEHDDLNGAGHGEHSPESLRKQENTPALKRGKTTINQNTATIGGRSPSKKMTLGSP
jgi:hypothetical protein